MSKTKAAKIKTAPNAGALKAYFDRVNRIEDDAEAVREAARDLTTEIKSAGYNAKALKRMVKESRRKSDAQLEADLELYRSLLAMPGATYRSVADKVNVPRSTLHRLVPRSDRGTDHDPETGELKPEDGDGRITESCGGGESVSDGAAETRKDGNMPGSVPGEETSSPPSVLVGAAELGGHHKHRAGVAPGPQDPIDLAAEHPVLLKGPSAGNRRRLEMSEAEFILCLLLGSLYAIGTAFLLVSL